MEEVPVMFNPSTVYIKHIGKQLEDDEGNSQRHGDMRLYTFVSCQCCNVSGNEIEILEDKQNGKVQNDRKYKESFPALLHPFCKQPVNE